jgi:type I site-specific restriction endonuclease
MTDNQNPEQKARDKIDALLIQAGWVVLTARFGQRIETDQAQQFGVPVRDVARFRWAWCAEGGGHSD